MLLPIHLSLANRLIESIVMEKCTQAEGFVIYWASRVLKDALSGWRLCFKE